MVISAPCTVVDPLPVCCLSKHYPVTAVQTIYVIPHSTFISVAFYFCSLAGFQASCSLEKSFVFRRLIVLWVKSCRKLHRRFKAIHWSLVQSSHDLFLICSEVQSRVHWWESNSNKQQMCIVCLFFVIYLFVHLLQVCTESHGISGLPRKRTQWQKHSEKVSITIMAHHSVLHLKWCTEPQPPPTSLIHLDFI